MDFTSEVVPAAREPAARLPDAPTPSYEGSHIDLLSVGLPENGPHHLRHRADEAGWQNPEGLSPDAKATIPRPRASVTRAWIQGRRRDPQGSIVRAFKPARSLPRTDLTTDLRPRGRMARGLEGRSTPTFLVWAHAFRRLSRSQERGTSADLSGAARARARPPTPRFPHPREVGVPSAAESHWAATRSRTPTCCVGGRPGGCWGSG